MQKLFLTGAHGDIGNAIKELFEKRNFVVIAPTRNEMDLENINSISQYFNTEPLDFDCIIHAAGLNVPNTLAELSIENLEKHQKVNYISFLEILKILTPKMKKVRNGKILAISSLYGTISRAGRLPYATSKHALNGLIQTLACELAEFNILVNSLSPGFVDTKMTKKNNTPKQIQELASKIPLKRLAKPQDIAEVAYFLCSDKNAYINGQDIIVDGGFMIEGGI